MADSEQKRDYSRRHFLGATRHAGRSPDGHPPVPRLGALNLGELWAYRELLFFLIWRDIKVRYKQTALGAALGGAPARR